jgi:hypothetical protein
MHFEILLEEPSMENVINAIMPRLVGEKGHTWQTHPHEGKGHLLKRLPQELRAYRKYLPVDWYIVIIIDQDQSDCKILKQRILNWAAEAGLSEKALVRIVVTALEAWFLGDIEALEKVFPKLSRSKLSHKATYRDPDTRPYPDVDLDTELKKVHYGGYYKLRHSAEISPHLSLDTAHNRSHSFQVTLAGLRNLVGSDS